MLGISFTVVFHICLHNVLKLFEKKKKPYSAAGKKILEGPKWRRKKNNNNHNDKNSDTVLETNSIYESESSVSIYGSVVFSSPFLSDDEVLRNTVDTGLGIVGLKAWARMLPASPTPGAAAGGGETAAAVAAAAGSPREK